MGLGGLAPSNSSCSPSDVRRSAVGLALWVVALAAWVTVFQTQRARWGALGDALSFTIPLGAP